jgi:multiple sugar transport system substrate-binding protein
VSTPLTGLCWDHPRSWRPLDAAAAVRTDVRWRRRSLDSFNEQPLEELVDDYDLIVIDHPFVSRAVSAGLLQPLEPILGDTDLLDDAIGIGHHAYEVGGVHWAVAVDVACQVSALRTDLLTTPAPNDWSAVLELARSRAIGVCACLAPADAFCSFLSLCAFLGHPFSSTGSPATEEALALLAELAALVPVEALDLNPPDALVRMSRSDDIAYIPLLFGYAVASHGDPRIRFADAPRGRGFGPVLGGSGIAVSRHATRLASIADYLGWLLAPGTQQQVLAAAQGQPPNRAVWSDPMLDEQVGGFFSNTRDSLLAAVLRPREAWWPAFQARAMADLHEGLRNRWPPSRMAARMWEHLDEAAA